MKKWALCLICGFLAVSSAAQIVKKEGKFFVSDGRLDVGVVYTHEELMQKINAREELDFNQMPYPFWYVRSKDGRQNQQDMDAFYAAEKVYKQNPENFNAVLNLATVIMSLNDGRKHGPNVNDMQIGRARRLLEKADKMRPNYLPIYERQDILMFFQAFGYYIYKKKGYTEEIAVAFYRAHPYFARKRLAILQKLLPAGKGDMYAAYHICKALGLKEEAYYREEIRKWEARKYWREQYLLEEFRQGFAASVAEQELQGLYMGRRPS